MLRIKIHAGILRKSRNLSTTRNVRKKVARERSNLLENCSEGHVLEPIPGRDQSNRPDDAGSMATNKVRRGEAALADLCNALRQRTFRRLECSVACAIRTANRGTSCDNEHQSFKRLPFAQQTRRRQPLQEATDVASYSSSVYPRASRNGAFSSPGMM